MSKVWGMCYTAKCRNCGKITEWFVSRSDFMDYDTFYKAMCEKMKQPILGECECSNGIWTISEMLSFSKNKNLSDE